MCGNLCITDLRPYHADTDYTDITPTLFAISRVIKNCLIPEDKRYCIKLINFLAEGGRRSIPEYKKQAQLMCDRV